MHIYTHNYTYYTCYYIFYMKIPHKFGHIRVNFLQAVRLQVTFKHNTNNKTTISSKYRKIKTRFTKGFTDYSSSAACFWREVDFFAMKRAVGFPTLVLKIKFFLSSHTGNVVDCEDKAILTWRAAEENPTLTKDQIKQRVEEALPGKKICFIRNPPYEEDTTGSNAFSSFNNGDLFIQN